MLELSLHLLSEYRRLHRDDGHLRCGIFSTDDLQNLQRVENRVPDASSVGRLANPSYCLAQSLKFIHATILPPPAQAVKARGSSIGVEP